MLCLGVAVVAGDSAVVVVLVCVERHRTQTQEKFGTDRKKGIWTV